MEMNSETVDRLASLVTEVLAEKGMLPGKPQVGTACSLPHGMAAAGPVSMETKSAVANPLVRAGADRVGHATEGAAPDGQCQTFAEYIDHTLLKPNATDAQVREVCKQAREFKFASVCINPCHITMVARELTGTQVRVCTVIGFPLGAMTSESKAFETRDAVSKGAEEIDMVINVGKLKSGDFQYVTNDIRAVVEAAQSRLVKVIIETSLLDEDDKVAACILSKAAGAQYVKTSTGFNGGGATPEDIALMRRIVGSELGVKASGGVRDCNDAAKLIQAGASRLGASASVAIVSGKKGTGGY